MSPDRTCSILAQTMVALLIIEEQIGSPGLSTCTCSNSLRTGSFFNTCITIPTFQENAGGPGRPGLLAIVTSNIMAYSSTGGSLIPSPNISQCVRQPLHRKSWDAIQWCVFLLFIWGIHISRVLMPVGVHHRCTTAINSNL